MFQVCCSLHSGYLISKPVNPQCINRKTLSIFHLHIYTTSERQHHCSWAEVGSLGLNPLDESIHFGDKKPQLKRSHPVERRGKDVSLHVHQHLVPPHMLPMTTSTTTSLLTHSCQLQNLTRQRRCLCQIWAVWRSCENASSSPNMSTCTIRYHGVSRSQEIGIGQFFNSKSCPSICLSTFCES